MKRILFVDDELRVLQGLERGLHPYRSEYDMVFVTSGHEALDRLAAAPFDVLVTDMRMPGMDGAALLAKVRELYPGVARIVLSGHVEFEAVLRSVGVTHQFVNKPCDVAKLHESIGRLGNLHTLLADEGIRTVVGQIGHLPAMSGTYAAVSKALAQEASMKEVATIIGRDAALTAKLLQVVSSAYFGATRPVTDIQSAAALLGTSMLRDLVLSTEAFRAVTEGRRVTARMADFQTHSVLAAAIARRIAAGTPLADDAYVACIIHDIGALILASHFPARYAEIEATAREKACCLHDAEMSVLGTTHAEIGAYLLGLWGLPYSIVEAVANHHRPERVANPRFDLLSIVYIASALANQQNMLEDNQGSLNRPEARAYLGALGVKDKLSEWNDIAREVAEQMEPVQ